MDFKELKRRARTAIRANFLLCIVAGLAMAVLVEGSTNIFSNSSTNYTSLMTQFSESTETLEGTTEKVISAQTTDGETVQYTQDDAMQLFKRYTIVSAAIGFLGGHLPSCLGLMLNMFTVNSYGFIGFFLCVLGSNVVEVGVARFYLVNLKRKAYMNELFYPFNKKKYWRTMVISLYRTAYIMCWGMLLIVPGIIKAYEYRLVPYLLAEDEEKKMDETFALSKKLMKGHKKEAFLFDLSFIGWDILGACTMGIVATLYTNPYKYASRAEFYNAIRMNDDADYRGPGSTKGGSSTNRNTKKDPFAGYHAYQKKN